MSDQVVTVSEMDYPETATGGDGSRTASAADLRTMVIVNRRNVVPDEFANSTPAITAAAIAEVR